MKRAAVPSILIAVVLLALGVIAEAQQPKKVTRIGYLSSTNPARESARFEAIRLALRELGYTEGQNIATEYRYAEGKQDRYAPIAAELARLKVDVIVVAGGDPAIRAAINATKTIPIVMVGGGADPVEAGVVESLARPGGNVTGLTNLSRGLSSKRLELLKEAVPKIARVGVLIIPTNPSFREHVRALADASDVLRLDRVEVVNPIEMKSTFSEMAKNGDDAVLVTNDSILHNQRKGIAELAAKHRLPSVAELREFAEDGGSWRTDRIFPACSPCGGVCGQNPERYEA